MAEEDKMNYQLYKIIPISGSCYGFISFDTSLSEMLKLFYESNDDQKSTMSLIAMGDHIFDKGFEAYDPGTLTFIGTKEVVVRMLIKRLKDRKDKCSKRLCKNRTVVNRKSQIYI